MFPRARNYWSLALAIGVAVVSHVSCNRVEAACGDYLLTRDMTHGESSNVAQRGMMHRDISDPRSETPIRTCVGGSCQRDMPPLVPIQPLRDHQLSKKFAAAAGENDESVISLFSIQSPSRDHYPRPIEDGIFHPPRIDTI